MLCATDLNSCQDSPCQDIAGAADACSDLPPPSTSFSCSCSFGYSWDQNGTACNQGEFLTKLYSCTIAAALPMLQAASDVRTFMLCCRDPPCLRHARSYSCTQRLAATPIAACTPGSTSMESVFGNWLADDQPSNRVSILNPHSIAVRPGTPNEVYFSDRCVA